MRLAFCLFRYFPFGGLERNFLRIALACQGRGHSIQVYTVDWQGSTPDGFEVTALGAGHRTNHGRNRLFVQRLIPRLA